MTNTTNTIDTTDTVLQSYTVKENETVVCIENFTCYSYKVYAVYVNGEYDRRIKVKKY
jgi:hypothetical protein